MLGIILRTLITALGIWLATYLTLGMFLLLLNAAMLNLAGWFVDGFDVVGFWSSVFGAIVISVVSGICAHFIGPRGSYEVMVIRRD